MNGWADYQGMEPLPTLDEAVADALLAGTGSPDEDLALLAEFVEGIRTEASRPVEEALVDRHVPLLVEAARAAAPAADAASPGGPARIRRLIPRLAGSGLALKVLAGSVALAAVAGAAAGEGLPEGAQRAIARGAALVGLERVVPPAEEPALREEALEMARTEAMEHCEDPTHPEQAADCPVLERILDADFALERTPDWTSDLYLEHELYRRLRIRTFDPERERPVQIPYPVGEVDPTEGGTRLPHEGP